jgi:pyruvate dehydrogenase E2 component (dihydrolipoamide acetyltransferase)
MPILGADMVAGTLIAWRKQPGDTVRKGDIIAEVETDKGLIDVEVFGGGVIERLLVEPGQTVPTGTLLAILREDGAPAPPAAPLIAAAPPAPAPPPPGVVPPPVEGAEAGAAGRIRVAPRARRRASELGLDLAGIPGTGADGAVTAEDVERAAEARITAPIPAAAPAPAAALDRQARMRRTIGAAMARSKREVPHYYLATTIDMHRALDWLRARNLERPVADRLLPGVLLLKAVALALREAPELNARWAGDQVVTSEAVHIGVAISLRQGGLVAPALHDAGRRSLDDLMHGFRDLVQRARAGGLRSSEMSDPTITVTSLGDQGVETVFGIIYPPQVAIVGFGTIVERPWVVDGAVVSRPVVTATLAADHRVSDGHRGGLFLAAVGRRLQAPEQL